MLYFFSVYGWKSVSKQCLFIVDSPHFCLDCDSFIENHFNCPILGQPWPTVLRPKNFTWSWVNVDWKAKCVDSEEEENVGQWFYALKCVGFWTKGNYSELPESGNSKRVELKGPDWAYSLRIFKVYLDMILRSYILKKL